MEADLEDVSEVAIIDSGASHSLTGNQDLLHNFCQLKCAVPLNVATKGGGASISGTGELWFRAPDRRTVTLKEVLYCEQARSTLVSLAALRKDNISFLYDNHKDCFEFFDVSN
jgi:hypothetical protein